MKQIIRITFSLVFLVSCNNSTKNKGEREFIPNPEKYALDEYLEINDSLKYKFTPDTLIGQLSLNNTQNVNEYLGKDVMKKLIDDSLPYSSVTSKDGEQRLTFYFHPGNIVNTFSEFKVSYNNKKDRVEEVTSDRAFKTESGIELGMTEGDILAIKGKPQNRVNNETTVFHYKIENMENSEFLKTYNMPVYYADYEFNNGYLIEFRFGFEYP
ncbi:hypothetical protein ACFFVB_03595 [Formosa undariae]|uniref:Lipoprotein n=1 Tax=Formosa undariae TaxID=1325436 RepID=A0ABV5EY78_9FLAO